MFYSHFLPLRQVNVSLLDVIQVGDHLGEGVSVDDQTFHPLGVIGDNVGGSHFLAVQSLLSEEVSFVKMSDELLVRAALLLGHLHSAAADDEEGVAHGALSDDVLALLVAVLLQHVSDLDEGLLGQVHEGGDRLEEGAVLGLLHQAGPHHDGLEALSLDGPQFAVSRGWRGK